MLDWSERLGVPRNTLAERIRKFGDNEEAYKMVFTSERHFWMRAATFVEYKGETRCLMDWAKVAGITSSALCQRLKKGYSMEQAMQRLPPYRVHSWNKLHGGKRIVLDGVEDNITGHAKRRGLKISCVKSRITKNKMSVVDALTMPLCDKEERLRKARMVTRSNNMKRKAAALGIIM